MTHAELVQVAAKWLRRRGCSVVLTEPVFADCESPDAIGWRYGDSTMVECKVSRADFLADTNKQARKRGRRLGNRAYYLAPAGLITANEVSARGWGLLEVRGGRVFVTVEALPWEPNGLHTKQETLLLLSELRRYHAQGIRYRKLGLHGFIDDGALGSLAKPSVRAEALKGERHG